MKILRWMMLTVIVAILLLGGCREEKPVVYADPPKPLAAAVTNTPVPVPTNTPLPKAGPYISHYQPGQGLLMFKVRIRTMTDGWAIGRADYADHDHILITTDAGQTWRDVTPPQPAGASPRHAEAYFPDADSAYVIYTAADQSALLDEFVVWRTSNSGQSWQVSAPLETTGLEEFFVPEQITFADPQTGWLSVSIGVGMSHNFTSLYQTLDGGTTWTRILDPLSGDSLQTCEKTGMLFVSQQNGWVTMDCQGLTPGVTMSTTADGGKTWTSMNLPEPFGAPYLFANSGNCYTHSAHSFGAEHGLVAVTCEELDLTKPTENFLYITEDGGQNWKSLPAPEGKWHFYSFYQGYLVGPEKIWHTNNQAGSVAPISYARWQGEYDFINSQMGWAVSHDAGAAGLYRTMDSAVTWEKLIPVIVE